MANTFTNFDAARTSALVFMGFVSTSVGQYAASMDAGREGSSGVYFPTISGVAISDVSSILGYGNKQSISNSAVLVNFDKYKGFNITIDNDQQSTTDVDLVAVYAEQQGRLLAEQIDSDLFTEALSRATGTTAAAGTYIASTDVAKAWAVLDAAKVPQYDRVWVAGATAHGELRAIADFSAANYTGNAQSNMVTGAPLTVLGAPVYMSPSVTATKALLIYKPALALAINRKPDIQIGRVPGQFGITIEGSVKYGVKAIDGQGLTLITT